MDWKLAVFGSSLGSGGLIRIATLKFSLVEFGLEWKCVDLLGTNSLFPRAELEWVVRYSG